ncbi:hypothetical protein GGQ88_000904 [Novosphingobium hassiacum]|uniref:Uncharacterized protein n=1 Tax=Novosphingobium hassiacum TaxID=173676 RepID=A0A7W5ZWB8_9SPHN|nr:hypothetical protein [Novosphingobium hassiacum]MBB3859664.1 hypothetical protein [Novosphingobium hassiacum]
MSAAKPLASLSPALLARKGAARPAMRPQLALSAEEQSRVIVSMGGALPAATQDDLGWNDMGEEGFVPAAHAEPPAIVKQIEDLAAAVTQMQVPDPVRTQRTKGGKAVRSALQEGRKAAFTLRLDNYRHLRLRLACTLEGRSAQGLVIEALDRFLADLPGIEDLAKRAVRN